MTTETTEQSIPVTEVPEIKLLNVIEADVASNDNGAGCCGGSCHA